jgi:hypothetical protein
MTVKKNRSTPEGQELWRAAENAASAVQQWPEWKRGHAGSGSVRGDSGDTSSGAHGEPPAKERG